MLNKDLLASLIVTKKSRSWSKASKVTGILIYSLFIKYHRSSLSLVLTTARLLVRILFYAFFGEAPHVGARAPSVDNQ